MEKKNPFIQRLERDCMYAITEELRHKPFSEIRISDLCRHTNYPRSSFYKYYYDLEDLFTDYLDRVWQSLKIREDDTLLGILKKIISFQESNAEYASIYRINCNDIRFSVCMKKVLQKHLLNYLFLKDHPNENISVPNEFVADYIIRILDLLMQYKDSMDDASFRQVSEFLLNRKVC